MVYFGDTNHFFLPYKFERIDETDKTTPVSKISSVSDNTGLETEVKVSIRSCRAFRVRMFVIILHVVR